MGWADYLSRHPVGEAATVSKYDERFVIAVFNRLRLYTAEKIQTNQNSEKTNNEAERITCEQKEQLNYHTPNRKKRNKTKHLHSNFQTNSVV